MPPNTAISASVLCLVIVLSAQHLAEKSPNTGSSPEIPVTFKRFVKTPHEGDITCHYWSSAIPALPVVDERFQPPERSIFFHETSCKGSLNSRQGCSVESAARENPDWQVYVLFSAEVPKSALFDRIMKNLTMIPNVHFYRVEIWDYLKGTPAEALALDGLPGSRFGVTHASDVLRYATLHKFGGLYLDLDVVVARALAPLGWEWAAREPGAATVGAAALALSHAPVGREVAHAVLRDIAVTFRGDKRTDNGPMVITRVLRRRCNVSDARDMSRRRCRGFQVYESDLVYPLHYRQARKYFRPGRLVDRSAFVHHLYNARTFGEKVHARSAYAQLARRHCPAVFAEYQTSFGT